MKKIPGILPLSILVLVLPSCQKDDRAGEGAAVAATVPPATRPMAHDPAHPPVDCPLRKAGLDPTKMKPFEQVEQYINFLEREDRALWQKPQEVVAALNLHGDEIIYDLGAGSGYFSFPMAEKLSLGGKVIAADTEGEMVRHIHHKAMTNGIKNYNGLTF